MKDNEAFDFSELILKYLKNELSRDEERAFLDSVSKDALKKKLLDYYQDRENLDRDLTYHNRIDTEDAWNRVLAKKRLKDQPTLPVNSSSTSLFKTWMPYAAILFCILSLGAWKVMSNMDDHIIAENQFGYKNDVIARPGTAVVKLADGEEMVISNSEELNDHQSTDKNISRTNEITVSNAGKFKVSLADGSTVWVSSSSKLKYPSVFNGSERRVSLEGEAYFDIAKDAKKPFYVEVGGKAIRVLGTKFNVSAYTAGVRTTLLEGSVRIEDGKNVSLLKPGQQAIFNSEGIAIQAANVEKEVAWKNGYFTFDHDQIKDIMQEIGRWYEVTITYEGNYKDEVYSGSIPRTSSLGGVLQALTDVSALQFEIEGRNVKVKKN